MIKELLIMPEEAVDDEDNCWCQRCRYITFYDAYMCMHKKAVLKYGDLFVEGIWIHKDDFWRECKYYRRDDR
jgi:hypothetical protein